ncbi:hypothetical protein SAMD00019534_075730 [Acytostelium subglobosum LB1]|uniref:hypothetical protein n=1 Tax=Acytostelium subglobosum LB1 TaxID=1410327 RepID=UPI000644CA81|nr:hypothetical protein SAMD00019534_075730 [Acytostelium subglobosum LB1]GAM24398.1 hypothetical protein SAMD00019534_075730 [Acytostelium subglobosum LB1]|eukprot:XP_012752724.1 hypothetical protein SAMD00019534_075730 [Acytostelium subglobosum LB1]
MDADIIEIKPATKEDLVVVWDMIKELAVYEKLIHMVVGSVEQLEQWAFGEEKVIYVFVGWVNGQVAGYTLHYLNFSTFLCRPGLYIEDIYIRPQYRAKGFGKKMLLHLCKIAADRGYGRVEWQVLDWNTPSINFYESLGAKPMKEWIQYRLVGDQITKHAEDFTKMKC